MRAPTCANNTHPLTMITLASSERGDGSASAVAEPQDSETMTSKKRDNVTRGSQGKGSLGGAPIETHFLAQRKLLFSESAKRRARPTDPPDCADCGGLGSREGWSLEGWRLEGWSREGSRLPSALPHGLFGFDVNDDQHVAGRESAHRSGRHRGAGRQVARDRQHSDAAFADPSVNLTLQFRKVGV